MRDIADFPQPPLVRGKSAMSRIAYVNGRYLPYAKAAVHAEDRGFQFADAVYEVIAVNEGRLVDAEGHMDRLERSLDELSILRPMSRAALVMVLTEHWQRHRTPTDRRRSS